MEGKQLARISKRFMYAFCEKQTHEILWHAVDSFSEWNWNLKFVCCQLVKYTLSSDAFPVLHWPLFTLSIKNEYTYESSEIKTTVLPNIALTVNHHYDGDLIFCFSLCVVVQYSWHVLMMCWLISEEDLQPLWMVPQMVKRIHQTVGNLPHRVLLWLRHGQHLWLRL